MKINKILSFIMIFVTCTFLFSCDFSGTTITNNIVNKEIDAESITVDTLEEYVQLAISKVEKAVIGITCTNTTLLVQTQSLGSGVIIKRVDIKQDDVVTGYGYYVITNRHVIMNEKTPSKDIKVYIGSEDLNVEASLIKYQTNTDLALLYFTTSILIDPVEIGDSINLKRGNFVIAIGNPYSFNYYGTATLGIISYPVRLLTEDIFNSTEQITNYYIQHDAAINSGNSGGGLFDLNGKLIGINTWKIVGDTGENIEGMGFSVPSNVVIDAFANYLE